MLDDLDHCPWCHKPAAHWVYYSGTSELICKKCAPPEGSECLLFERGVENPMDPKGTTAHVRDIKARRIDPKTKTTFYYQKPKTYFLPK